MKNARGCWPRACVLTMVAKGTSPRLVRRDAEDVDGEEEEEPYNVNEVPVPSSGLEAYVVF